MGKKTAPPAKPVQKPSTAKSAPAAATKQVKRPAPAAAAPAPVVEKKAKSSKKAPTPAPVSSDDEEEDEDEDEDEAIDFSKFTPDELRAYIAAMTAANEGDDEDDFDEDDDEEEGEEEEAAASNSDEDVDDENVDLEELIDLSSDATGRQRAAERERREAARRAAAKKGVPMPADDDDDDAEEEEEVEANFEFFDPCEKDYHGLKGMLRGLAGPASADIGSLADAIAGQAAVGTTVKTSADDDGPLGFISALSCANHAAALAPVKEFVLSNAGNDDIRAALTRAWEAPCAALLLSERVVNLPLEVAPVLYGELLKDIDYAATAAKKAGEDAKKWAFDQFIMIVRCTEAGAPGSAPLSKKKAKKAARGGGSASGAVDTSGLWFPKFEEEYLAQRATAWKRFPGAGTIAWPGVGKLPLSYLVLVVPRKGVEAVSEQLGGMFTINGGPAQW